ncbi:MAG: EamA family transporter [Clostridia bacterium]|nr:EamA family transporter [Clostridia bacterium]
MDLLFLMISAALLAGDFLIAGLYQRREGNSPEKVFRFNFFIGLFSVFIFFFINGGRLEFTAFSGILALVMTSLAILYTLLGFKILAAGGIAYYTFFLMTGGMVVPYIWGLLFLDEAFSWLRLIGLLLIVGSASLIYAGPQKLSPKMIGLCAAIFLLNGFVSVISKEHQISDQAVSSAAYVFLTAMVKVLLCGGILIYYHFKKKEKAERAPISGLSILLLAASALLSGLSYMLQLNSAANLPATIVYPIVTGGGIVFTVAAGWIFLKEKPTKQLLLGVMLCFIGTCLFI